ncbi:MAG: lipocalin family protein [Sphingobacterium sp.]|uniref:lipocalin family protein n=1 Tax=Sphingobacterium sp. JB170 TaxID=1434842 RepID=UPI000B35FBFA|nr:lipocalin family protein [Sphingobacterium sp. JB170]
MRKHILSAFTLIVCMLLLASCGAQKKSSNGSTSTQSSGSVGQNDPSAGQWRSGLKGKWILNSVDREDIPSAYTIKNIFDEAPVDCFVGSTWTLPGGNHRGSITFNASGTLCADGAVRAIVWSVYDNKNDNVQPEFQFKKIYAGETPKNVTTGYRLDLSYTDGESLVMRMPIPLDEGSGNLVFNFSRVED